MNGLQLKLLSSEEIGNIFKKCVEFLSEGEDELIMNKL